MPETPPQGLVELLKHLGLATAEEVAAVRGRASRLARELPVFESVWVDALAQARILTPYQAARINAGDGERLRIGPYTICGRMPWPGYAQAFFARRSGQRQTRQLWVFRPSVEDQAQRLERLEQLAQTGPALAAAGLPAIVEAGRHGELLWAASPQVADRPASQRLVHYGRYSADEVRAIARQMAGQLAALDRAGWHHGDVGLDALRIGRRGEVRLLAPGLRPIVRPDEGYAFADLAPEAYETLAPERVAQGRPSNIATDLHACGCLWWHLLTGRSPRSGGDALAKLQAVHVGTVPDVRLLAPETPPSLARAIARCVAREPGDRPASPAELLALLDADGVSTRSMRSAGLVVPRHGPRRKANGLATRLARSPLAAAAAVLVGIAATVALAVLALGGAASFPPPASVAGGAAGQRWAEPRPVEEGLAQGTPQPEDAAPSDRETATTTAGDEILLPADRPLAIESVRLRTGQTVRGAGEQPTVLVVPRGGLEVTANGVVFENVAFVPPPAIVDDPEAVAVRPLVRLRAARVEFRRCIFRGGTNGRSMHAVEWAGPASPDEAALPSGQVTLRDCVLEEVAAAVASAAPGALGVELENSLYLGHGPLVNLPQGPSPDAPVSIGLLRTTLRDCGPLVRCAWQSGDPGPLTIRATGCVLLPRADLPLLVFAGKAAPERVLRSVLWSGEGTILGPTTPVVAWEVAPGRLELLDDSQASMAGLVRSRVEFAAAAGEGPAGSEVLRWQAPLRSPDPPGVEIARLPAVDLSTR